MNEAQQQIQEGLLKSMDEMATEPSKARRKLRRSLKELKPDGCTLGTMVRELVLENRPFEAVELASAWIERDHRSPLGHLELGRALLARAALRENADGGLRDRRAAMKVLRHAAELDPTSADTLDSLAEACASSGDPDGYVEARWKYLEAAGSQDHTAWVELGRAMVEVDSDRAIECFRRALAIDPSQPEPYDDLYALLIDDEDEEAADEVLRSKLEEATEDQEEQLEGYLELLASFSDRGAWTDVMGVGQKILEIDPESVEAMGALATALAEDGEYTEAMEYIQKALEFSPEDTQIQALLTEVRERMH